MAATATLASPSAAVSLIFGVRRAWRSSELAAPPHSSSTPCAAKAAHNTHLVVEYGAGAPYDDPDAPPSALTAVSGSTTAAPRTTAASTAGVRADSIKLT